MEYYRAVVDAHHQNFRSVIDYGLTAVKAAMLINGGAAIAILAFLGNLKPGAPLSIPPTSLAFPLLSFSAGVLLGALGTMFGYFTQYKFTYDFVRTGQASIVGILLHLTAVLFVVIAFGCFAYGIWQSYQAIF